MFEGFYSQETQQQKSQVKQVYKRPKPMKMADPMFDPNRQVLYRNFHEIGGNFKVVYLVEISRSKHKFFLILFPNFEKPSIYLNIILSYKIGEKLLSYVNNVFEDFIQTIDVRYGNIVLQNYHTRPKNEPCIHYVAQRSNRQHYSLNESKKNYSDQVFDGIRF